MGNRKKTEVEPFEERRRLDPLIDTASLVFSVKIA